MSPLLIGYFVFLLLLTPFAVAGLYHSFKYANRGDKTKFAAGLYLAVIAFILVAGFVLIGSTDFSGDIG